MTAPGNYFAGHFVERRAEERVAADWLDAARGDPATRYVAMRGTAVLMRSDDKGEATQVAFLRGSDPRVTATPPGHHVLLGWYRGERCKYRQRLGRLWPRTHRKVAFAEIPNGSRYSVLA